MGSATARFERLLSFRDEVFFKSHNECVCAVRRGQAYRFVRIALHEIVMYSRIQYRYYQNIRSGRKRRTSRPLRRRLSGRSANPRL